MGDDIGVPHRAEERAEAEPQHTTQCKRKECVNIVYSDTIPEKKSNSDFVQGCRQG